MCTQPSVGLAAHKAAARCLAHARAIRAGTEHSATHARADGLAQAATSVRFVVHHIIAHICSDLHDWMSARQLLQSWPMLLQCGMVGIHVLCCQRRRKRHHRPEQMHVPVHHHHVQAGKWPIAQRLSRWIHARWQPGVRRHPWIRRQRLQQDLL